MSEHKLIASLPSNKTIVRWCGEEYCLIDTSSKDCIPAKFFDYMSLREDGKISIRTGNTWGLMDIYGRILLSPRFSRELVFYNGICVVEETRADFCFKGVIDEDGKELVPIIYNEIFITEKEELGIFEGVYGSRYHNNFIFGCISEDSLTRPLFDSGGFVSYLYDNFGIDLYLRNNRVLSGKYECYYICGDHEYVFGGYGGYKIIGISCDEEYVKDYNGFFDFIDKDGNVLIEGISGFDYSLELKFIRVGEDDSTWIVLNKNNEIVTKTGSTMELHKIDLRNTTDTDLLWPLSTEEEIQDSCIVIAQIFEMKNIKDLILRVKMFTIYKRNEGVEEKFSWEHEYDPYARSTTFSEHSDDGSLLDALDGDPEAYWNID